MSTLIVEVCEIKNVIPHNNADAIEICVVKGWNCVTKKGEYKAGDKIIFIPPDAILPDDLIEKYGLRNYLAGKDKNRTKCVKLRGEMSYGIILPVFDISLEIGMDVSEILKIRKYEPPINTTIGDAAPEDPFFHRFSEIENINNFPDLFVNGEKVVVTEKIDGSNSRIWLGPTSPEDDTPVWKAGSNRMKRKMPQTPEEFEGNIYWFPYKIPSVRNLIEFLYQKYQKEIYLFGEIYGRVKGGLRSMDYGRPANLNYAAFAIKIDGRYIDYNKFVEYCEKFCVSTVPLLGIIDFNLNDVKELSMGNSALALANGKEQIREGCVVIPYNERQDERGNRAILKIINPDYLLLKHKKEEKGEVVDYTDI